MKLSIFTRVVPLLFLASLGSQATQLPSTIPLKKIAALYEASPLLKVYHLELFARNKEEAKKARALVEKIQGELSSGVSFQLLVDRYTQQEEISPEGELRGPHNLPKFVYRDLLAMKPKKVSKPYEWNGGIHLFQWVEKQPFTSAPATYLAYLEGTEKK